MHLQNPLTLDRSSSDGSHEPRLHALLRHAIGIGPVRPLLQPDVGGFVLLDEAIEIKSTQRICLQKDHDNLILRTWPGELKTQAKAFYQSGKAQKLMHFVIANHPVWSAQPNLQLAFRNSPTAQRLFPKQLLEASEYVDRWCGEDFAWVGAYAREEFEPKLWPWLKSRDYAAPEDDNQVDIFLKRLGKRDVFLRPGLEVTRRWGWRAAVELDERDGLIGDVRSAVSALLTELGEPLPPACVAPQL